MFRSVATAVPSTGMTTPPACHPPAAQVGGVLSEGVRCPGQFAVQPLEREPHLGRRLHKAARRAQLARRVAAHAACDARVAFACMQAEATTLRMPLALAHTFAEGQGLLCRAGGQHAAVPRLFIPHLSSPFAQTLRDSHQALLMRMAGTA
jgi:hypothetical protein